MKLQFLGGRSAIAQLHREERLISRSQFKVTMYYMGSNPTPEQLAGLMNYLEEVELEPEDITQNVIISKIRQTLKTRNFKMIDHPLSR